MCRRIILSAILTLALLPLLRAQCPNLDFSYGNFTGWQCYISNSGYSNGNTCYDSLTWTLCPQAVNGRHTIMSDIYDVDPHTCNGDTAGNELLPLVPDGFRYSARIGNSNCGAEAESIRYRLAVDSSNCWVVVHYAAVLELKNHADEMESRFGIRFQDTAGRLLPVGNLDLSLNDTVRMINCYGVYWTDWNALGVNLSPWIGQTVEIVVYAADCGRTGHFGYGYAVCECCSPKGNVRYCRNSSSAELSAPLGYHSYRWTDSAGRLLDTIPMINVINPRIGAVYHCQVGDGQGWKDTLSLQIRKTLINTSILSQRDSLTPFIHLANGSVITNGELLNQTWRISRRGAGTEYVCNDSAFDYCFKDTGWYEVQLTVEAANGCADTCSRCFRVWAFPSDLAVNAFLNPDRDTLWDVHAFCPEVRMVNRGKYDAYMTDIHVELYDCDRNLISSLSENVSHIKAGDTLVCRLSDSLRCTDYIGDYFLKAYVSQRFVFDTIKSNDTLVKPLFLNYPEKFELSVRDCEISYHDAGYGAYVAYRWWNVRLTPEYSVKMCASITKSSNFRLDSLLLTAQMLDTAGRVVQSQVIWIPSLQSYEASPTAFEWPNSMGNIQFPETRVPNYTGNFYVRVFFDAHPKDKNHADDTCMVRRQCIKKDVVDVRLKSVRPLLDSAEGMTYNTPVLTIVSTSNVDSWNTPLQVKVLDSNKNLLCYLKDTIPLIPYNNTLVYKMPCVFQVPNYTGFYRLEAGIGPKNDVYIYDNTTAGTAYCYKVKKSDVRMLSIRPQPDSVLGGTAVTPVVTVKNVGETDLTNVRICVTVDSLNLPFAKLEDTISFMAVGDSVTKCFSSRYMVPDYTGKYLLRAESMLPFDENKSDDTASCAAHCFINPMRNVTLLSVRPDADSLEGGNLTFPRVVLCNTGRDSMKNIGLEVLVVNKYDTVVAHLRDTIAAIPGGDTAELAFRSRYTVPDYTGSYRLKAVYGTDTIVSVAHCIYRPDTCDIIMLSVRPQQDSSFGIVKPVVRYCGYRNRYTYAVNHWDYVYVCLYDSNNVRLGMVNYNDYLNYKDTTVIRFSKGIKVFNYTGRYRLVAYVSYHASKNMIRSNDTVSCTGYCIGDTIDIRMLSVQPAADSAFGETKVTPVLYTYYRHPDLENSFVDVCVQMYDSSHVLLHQFKNAIFVNCNKTEKEVMSYVDWKVPDYTGVYYLKAFFVNVKKEENLSTANDTAFFKAHCIRHLKKDVALLSVRPQHDSAEVGTWTSPVVVVKNVGDLDVRNVAVKVQVDTCTSSSHMGDMFAYYWDTIPFLAAGDSVKWVLSARYQVREVWTGSYYRMYASVAVDSDEVNANNNASYDANCYKSVDFRLISFHIPSDTLWGGVPVCPKVRIVNNSVVKVKGFKFRMEVSDSAGTVLQSWEESGADYLGTDYVKAGDTVDFQCMQPVRVPNYNGVFRLRAAVSYLYKEYRLLRRDTLEQYYRCFHNDTIDVSLTDLLYPVTTEVPYGNTKLRPKVRVRNMSNVKLDSLRLTALVYDYTGALHDSVSEIMPTIAAGSLLNYQFTNPYKVPNATAKYDLLVRLEAPEGDVSLNDNSIRRQFRARFHFDTVDVRPLAFVMADTLWSGATVYPVLRMVNASAADVSGFSVWLEAADSAGKVMRRWEEGGISVPAGDTLDFPCSQSLKLPDYTGKFRMRAAVSQYPMDYILTGSDTLLQYFQCRRRDTVDVALAELLYPVIAEVLTGKTEVHPQVRVVNRGNVEVRNLVLSALVYDQSGSLADSLPGMILSIEAGVDTAYTFPSAYLVPDVTGSYSLVVRLAAPAGDVSEKDNELQRKLLSKKSLAVELVLKSNWQLGQNIPNPAVVKTIVPVTLPVPGTVRLQLFAADGRLLYRSEHAVAEGKSLLPLDLAGYAAGVYYYSVEYKGERKVRKMVVE